MDINYKQKLKVLSSQIDFEAKTGVVQNFVFVQDNMCEFFKNIDCDGLSMVPTHNCFFVVTKTRLKIMDYARWLDEISLETDIVKSSPARINILTTMKSQEKMIAYAMQEMCAIDNDTRKMRLLNSTKFPQDINIGNLDLDIAFDKIEADFVGEEYLVGTQKVMFSHLDFYRHVNNVEYVKMMLNTFSMEQIEALTFNDIQINYLHECREHDVLKIYRKSNDYGYDFVINNGDNSVVVAKFKNQ